MLSRLRQMFKLYYKFFQFIPPIAQWLSNITIPVWWIALPHETELRLSQISADREKCFIIGTHLLSC